MILSSHLLLASASQAADLPHIARGPYLQLATPTSVTVVWRTIGRTDPVVRFGTSADRLDQASVPANVVVRRSPDQPSTVVGPMLHSAPKNTFQYEARLEGLVPETKYFYAVYDGDRRIAGGDVNHHFRTHPPAGESRPCTIWVVGDSGTGDVNQKAVYTAMRDDLAARGATLDLYLHVGDMAYPKGRDDEFQETFFDIYQPTLRNTVCWAAMGNHEGATSKGISGVGPYYDAYVTPTRGEAGGLPSATEAFYSFDYGRIHFICLDSHDLDRSPAGAMARWLRADLDRTRAEWLVAFFHHPPYTKGSHDSDKEKQLIEMRELIMPILESGGVDVVLTGHSHIYERSMLIDGAYSTPTTAAGVVLDDGDGSPEGDGPYRKSAGIHPHEGAVQVVTGNGGAKVSRKGTSPVMRTVFVEHGSVVIDVAGDTLTGRMINREGVRRDLFAIQKRGTVARHIVAAPRVLPPFTPPKIDLKVLSTASSRVPSGMKNWIDPHEEWDYLAGSHPTGEWTTAEFRPDAAWKSGPAGFGFGDGDDATELKDMRGKYQVVYTRKDFELEPGERATIADFGLAIRYDDAFIAYLNGHEVLRVGVGPGRGKDVKSVTSHGAGAYEYFSLRDALPFLEEDENILAIEGHNRSLSSSDFTLDPYLVVRKKEAKSTPASPANKPAAP
jgi:hypothetical protein